MLKPAGIACCVILLSPVSAEAQGRAWFGTWKLRDAGDKPETLIYSDAGDGAMRMESVENRSVLVTRFDGKPAADIGADGGGGRALALKALSPTRYRWTFLIDGKPLASGVNTLAADRRSFREVSWRVSEPRKKVTLVYERR